MAAGARLTGTGLGFRAGGRAILADVDIEVAAGELVALVGPNGAGKSTLLGLLAGDLAPATGRVALDGRPVRGMRPGDLARLRAVMPQQTVLQFAFTAAEVVALGARAGRDGRQRWPAGRGVDREVDREADRVAAALARVGCADLADRPYPSLSGGEQAQVTLARVVAQDAPVVLLDEPTAHLDLRFQARVLRLARALADEGRAILAVLHDVNLAARWADRVMILADGRVAACGAPADTVTAAVLSAVYRHRIDVVAHPDGGPLALPGR
jgi:iron complex transport system ATP-binding protein